MTTLPVQPESRNCAISANAAYRLVPVEPPSRRPNSFADSRNTAIEAASGTWTMRSTTVGMNDGSTSGRPMPSMREPVTTLASGSPSRHPVKNAEFSGSTTHSRVACLWYRT